MSRHPRRDTGPELHLRKLLHHAGLRYRVVYPVPGMPRRTIDIAFTRRRVAVFVDGCFWHGCPEHGSAPVANAEWWAAKLKRNAERDLETTAQLRRLGWQVIRLWEHESPEEMLHAVLVEVGLEGEDGSGSASDVSPAGTPA